jgi:hypothetical protein
MALAATRPRAVVSPGIASCRREVTTIPALSPLASGGKEARTASAAIAGEQAQALQRRVKCPDSVRARIRVQEATGGLDFKVRRSRTAHPPARAAQA